MQLVMPMSCESGFYDPAGGGDWDRGCGGVRLLVVVMNQIVDVST